MKRATCILGVLLLLSLPVMAQSGTSSGNFWPSTITVGNATSAPPLKCGKYQHEVVIPAHCANTCDLSTNICTTECLWVAPVDECVENTHEVTEKEWVSLMDRIAQLEKQAGVSHPKTK